jgi:cellulose synthase/poly-beta-1,6-N-acetylglucosamine synthase-like glycosyltransferase
MTVAGSLLILCAVIYAVWMLIYWWGLFRLPHKITRQQPTVSVVIAARNEEKTISGCLDSLLKQNYPPSQYEIIVVDDHSSDKTPDILNACQIAHPNVRVVSAPAYNFETSPKVNALNEALRHSESELVLLTDADCRAGEAWISSMASCLPDDVGLVCGYSLTDGGCIMPARLLSVESLLFLTACAGGIGSGLLLGATAQNMALRRSAFRELGGCERFKSVFTGFDIFLIHLWQSESTRKIAFCRDPRAVITTTPPASSAEAFRQRRRWLSSIRYMKANVTLFFGLSAAMNGLLLVAALFAIWQPPLRAAVLWALVAKAGVEFMLAVRGMAWTRRCDLLPYFVLYEIVYPILMVIVSVASGFVAVRWKGRVLHPVPRGSVHR